MQASLEHLDLDHQQSTFSHFFVDVDHFEPHWHFHPQLELTYIQRGSGLRFIGDDVSVFEDDDLVLIGSFLPHQWVSSMHDDIYPTEAKAFVTHFDIDKVLQIPELDELRGLFTSAEFGLKFSSVPHSVLQKISVLPELTNLEAFVAFIEILLRLKNCSYEQLSSISFSSKSSYTKKHDRINRVYTYLLEHYSEAVKLNDLAAFMNVTPSSFSRWFKTSTGYTFNHYLNKLRIEKACQLILNTDLNLSEIAFSCGFETLSTFTRNFQKIHGMSARDYRSTLMK